MGHRLSGRSFVDMLRLTSGTGDPNGSRVGALGTVYFDLSSAVTYRNTDGGTTWEPRDLFDTVLNPAQITAATLNNWEPGTLGRVTLINFSLDTSRTITGLAGGSAGMIIALRNVGNATFVLTPANESASSDGPNRFENAGPLLTSGTNLMWMRYSVGAPSGTSARWRVLGRFS